MSNNEAAVWAAVLGALGGAALAGKTPEEKQALVEYSRITQQMRLRQQSLGTMPDLGKLLKDNCAYNLFLESHRMYLHGFFRGASVFSAALLEYLLKKKYGQHKFIELINKAREDKLIDEGEKLYLHGIRVNRNDFLHELEKEVKEEDAKLILVITRRLIDKIL